MGNIWKETMVDDSFTWGFLIIGTEGWESLGIIHVYITYGKLFDGWETPFVAPWLPIE